MEIVLNRDRILSALERRGLSSVREIAERLDTHRNTLSLYLNSHPLISKPVAALIELSGVPLGEALMWSHPETSKPYEPIAKELDILKREFPEYAFVLFGSRTKGKAKKYSDFDVGVFKVRGSISKDISALNIRKSELEERCPYMIQIVDLSHADKEFIKEIAPSWIFLGGSLESWVELNRSLTSGETK